MLIFILIIKLRAKQFNAKVNLLLNSVKAKPYIKKFNSIFSKRANIIKDN